MEGDSAPIVVYASIAVSVLTLAITFVKRLGGGLTEWANTKRRAAQEANDEYVAGLKERIDELKSDLAEATAKIDVLTERMESMQLEFDTRAREERGLWEQREIKLLTENWKYRQYIASTGVDPDGVKAAAEGHRQGDS